MKTLNILILWLSLFLFLARAQESVELTLETSIGLALKQSYSMQNATQQYFASKKIYEAQALVYATTADLTFRLPDYNESLSNQFNPISQRYEFYQLQTTYLRSNVSLSQPIALSGGTIALSGDFFKRNQL